MRGNPRTDGAIVYPIFGVSGKEVQGGLESGCVVGDLELFGFRNIVSLLGAGLIPNRVFVNMYFCPGHWMPRLNVVT